MSRRRLVRTRDPYPELEESWYADEREWGWTLDLFDPVPLGLATETLAIRRLR